MTPIPPCCASAMAMWASVTVSMAALMIGILRPMLCVRRVDVSASTGEISLWAGCRRTSSKVSPSSITSGIIRELKLILTGTRNMPDLRSDSAIYGRRPRLYWSCVKQVGRYQILEEIGRGATGIVYKALDPAIGRTIAIKALHLGEVINFEERQRIRERLRRERQQDALISHP